MNRDIFWRNVATQGAVGYGYAPGTTATVMMLPLIYFLGTLHLSYASYALFALCMIAFGWFVADRALPFFVESDPSMIVIDEAVAFIALFCFLPIHTYTILAGFVLFRLFDIFKPLGIAYFEHLPGVAGVMADDLAAACAANLCIQIAYYILG